MITRPSDAQLNGNTQGIFYDSATDTTTIDNNVIITKAIKNSLWCEGNINTYGDVYMNCYSMGGINYGFYKLIDFINDRDQVCYDKGVEGVNKANAAQNSANDAQNTANAALAATVVNAGATALVASNLATLNGIVTTHTAALATINGELGEIDTNLSTLNGKTSLMNAATTLSSNFIKSIKVYTAEEQITPVVTIDPYSPSLFSNGLQVNEILEANEISCDTLGCNTLNISGDLNLPNSTATLKSITTDSTSVQTIDGSAVYIGHFGSPVYINGLLYNPIANFFSQWE